MIRTGVHLLLHCAVPGAVARWVVVRRWRCAWLTMIATMAVDLDHLLADPIFDAQRCSIGLHPLHTWPAVLVYLLLTGVKRLRLVGLGLVLHMAIDALDCFWMAV